MEKTLVLSIDNKELVFSRTAVTFEKDLYSNVFAKYPKTVFETIAKQKYRKFLEPISKYYPKYTNWPLGEFLLERKQNADIFYKNFLNPYGDLEYCRFYITDKNIWNKKGLYLFGQNNELNYIGQTTQNYKTRINDGYGKIFPKNCYIDGQRTNCYVNNAVSKQLWYTEIYICPLIYDVEIKTIERKLIAKYQPLWNMRLPS